MTRPEITRIKKRAELLKEHAEIFDKPIEKAAIDGDAEDIFSLCNYIETLERRLTLLALRKTA